MSELWVGLRCIWRHKPRGGYGFVMRIPVTVTALGKRVRVRIDGTERFATVRRESLTVVDMRNERGSLERPTDG